MRILRKQALALLRAVFQLSAVADTPFIRLARDGTTSTGEFVAPHARHRFIELLHTS